MFVVDTSSDMQEAVERLGRLVRDLDLGSVLPATAKELLALGERIERTGRSLKTLAAARVAATEVWRGEGDRSAEDWLARTTGTTKQEAERLVETGARLADLPITADAVRRGQLSARQMEVIVGAAAADPGAERRLLATAQNTSLRDLQDECRRTRANADPDPDATARGLHARRCYRTWTDPDGTGHVHVSGPAATIARLDNAIRHRADQIFRDARAAGRCEPTTAYAFDATEQLLLRTGADRPPIPRGADANIIVRVDHLALLRGRTTDGEVCEIAGFGPVPVAVAREWMADAFVAAVLTKGADVTKVVHLGRRFTSEQRTALQWRDPSCSRRGCPNTLRLEYDHVEDWADTHTTRVEAGRRFCQACHRLKTIGWGVSEPDPDGKCEFSPP